MISSVAAALVLSTAALVSAQPAPADEGPEPPHLPQPALITRQVDIDMGDYFFKPNAVQVKVGETVTFMFTNSGQKIHDAFIGDHEAQEHHAAEMKSGGGHHHHDGTDATTVEPGKKGSIQHFFEKPGSMEIGCHVPGHYEVGMKIDITVVPF